MHNKIGFYLSITLLGLSQFSSTSIAAPVYGTEIHDTWSINSIDSGTTYAYYADSERSAESNIATAGDAHSAGDHFEMTQQQNGYSSTVVPIGFIIYNDVIFTDTSNPANTSNIDVSMNFWVDTSLTTLVNIKLTPLSNFATLPVSPSSGNSIVSGDFSSGNWTTAGVNVPLNTPMSLAYRVEFDPYQSSYYYSDYAFAGFNDAEIFNLPAGYTVNSVDGGIINNAFVSAVPLPASFWLMLTGLLSFIGFVRSRGVKY